MSEKEVSETLAKDYGDLRGEYDAIRGGVAVIDFSAAGKLQVSGKNSVQFLNGLISNDIKSLQAGEGVLAAFPTIQGKLLALCRIYNTGEDLLLELEAINREKIFKNLSRFVPAGEFFVTDASDQLALVSLQGPRAEALLETLTGQAADEGQFKICAREIAGTKLLVASHRRCGEVGFDLFVEADAAASVKRAILEGGKAFGAHEVG